MVCTMIKNIIYAIVLVLVTSSVSFGYGGRGHYMPHGHNYNRMVYNHPRYYSPRVNVSVGMVFNSRPVYQPVYRPVYVAPVYVPTMYRPVCDRPILYNVPGSYIAPNSSNYSGFITFGISN